MAQKISPVATRLYLNRVADSTWFDSLNTEKAIQADILFRNFVYHLGTHLSKSKNSYIVRMAVSCYQQNTHIECFIDNKFSEIKQDKSGLSENESLFSQISHQNTCSFFPQIKQLTHSVSQKLSILTFIQNYKKRNNIICIPFNNNNYIISLIRVSSEFQSAGLIGLSIAQDLSQGKSVNQTFSEISTKYAKNSKLLAFVKGFRIQCKGRITNDEEASSQTLEIGRIARGKFNDLVDYSTLSAQTALGVIGIKVWVNFNIKN